jgi:hypothetical protein
MHEIEGYNALEIAQIVGVIRAPPKYMTTGV